MTTDFVKRGECISREEGLSRTLVWRVEAHDIGGGVDVLRVQRTVTLEIASVNHVLGISTIPLNLHTVDEGPKVVELPWDV